MPRYLNAYDFCAQISDAILDNLIVVADFDCQITVDVDFRDGEPVATCTDVFIDGQSLRGGSAVTTAIRLKVMEAADEELSAGGPLWDAVAAREGVAFIGPAGSPDAYWAVL